MILWTRLAIDPLKGGGMGTAPIEVEWRIARNEAMTDVAKSAAGPEWASTSVPPSDSRKA